MQDHDEDPFEMYRVVINHEEQYSIWPSEKTIPDGWTAVGKEGPKQDCLDYIGEVWTDMRPLSLRKRMEEWARNPPPPLDPPDEPEPPPLVDRLCAGDQPLIFSCRPERTAAALKERLEMGHVHLTFTQTRGGTELGVQLEPEACDWSGADFAQGTGTVRLAGTLTLDYVPVRCLATIDVATLEGSGRLERVEETAAA